MKRLTLFFLLCCGLLIACGGDGLPPLVYVGWDEAGQAQLFVQDLGRDPHQLTSLTGGDLRHFAIAPDARQIAYALQTGLDSSIWLMGSDGTNARELLACGSAACGQIVWAPDGSRLVYERQALDEDGDSNAATLHWLDAQTGESQPLLENEDARGSAVRFAPDGSALSYVDTQALQTRVYNFQTGETFTVPNEIGSPAEWSPAGDKVLYSNQDVVVLHGAEGDLHDTHSHDFVVSTRLFLADTRTGQFSQLSPAMGLDDGNGRWSPDGQWIGFGRRPPRTGTGRQLWLMRADGGDARALSDDLRVNHGPPVWSPDGSTIAFQRFELDVADGDPEIWLVDVASAEMQPFVAAGMLPAWLVSTP